MNESEIHQKLRASGAAGVGDLEVGAKDPVVDLSAEGLVDALRFLRDDADCAMEMLHCVTAVERDDRFELWYHLNSLSKRHSISLRVKVAKPDGELTDDWHPSVPSAASVYRSADWHEREQWDLLGVRFADHPDHRRILLPEEWIGFPLRKNYVYPQAFGEVPLELDGKPMYERKPGEPVTTGADPRPAGTPLNQPPTEPSTRPHAGGKAPPPKEAKDG